MRRILIDPREFAADTIEEVEQQSVNSLKQDEDDPINLHEAEGISELVKESIPTRQRSID